MIRSLYTGASGLKSHQSKMDVVGNNISNVNTVGYKSSRATFSDFLSQKIKGASAARGEVGSTNPKQIGLGSSVASIDTIFKDGAPMATGKNTDLCLSGDGLFMVRRGKETYYTRDGAFEFDASGNYVLPGSGHFVQGWTATDGVIDTKGAVGDIKVAFGKKLVKATDLVTYVDNLNANVPTVTKISVTTYKPLDVEADGRRFTIAGIPRDGKTWRFQDDVPLGATTATVINDSGDTRTVRFSPAALWEMFKGEDASLDTGIISKGSVTAQYPLTLRIDGKSYTAIGMNNSYSYRSKWDLKEGGARAGSNTLTITNGTEDITFTLKSPLTENIGQTQTQATTAVASKSNPVTLTYSDGTTAIKTDGSYSVGTAPPIATTATVYDSSGTAYTVPLYFIRKGGENSNGKWLVSLSPDASVTKGQTVTSKITDTNGNIATVSFTVAELQFDESGKLITSSDSDVTGMLTLGGQKVTVDFAKVTQHPDETTVKSTSRGGIEGTLKDVQIDSSGIVTGIYTNGERRVEAQVALAHFSNSAGLLKAGTSLYQTSANSGNPMTIKAGDFGTTITSGALEMSNVDVANEFADMIITQRGFQSNAKIVTVGDEMTERAINMKR